MNIIIPEQFTVKAHPALLEGEGGGGAKKGGTIIPVYIHIHIQNHTKQTKTPIFWTSCIGHIVRIRTNPGNNTYHRIW